VNNARFTIECRRIFRRATVLAAELEHPAVSTEHLLLAMLEVPSSGAGILARAGASAERVRAEVVSRTSWISDGDALALLGIDAAVVRARIEDAFGPDAFDSKPAWTELAQQVLLHAGELAEADSTRRAVPDEERVVGTDWLFLALLDFDEGVAAEVVHTLGIDQAETRATIEREVPTMNRLRHAMWQNPVHGRYRAVLETWSELDHRDKAATRSVIEALHGAHDHLLLDIRSRLDDQPVDLDDMIAAYFIALEPPVEEAELAMTSHGINITPH
jgi:ATP-dependent Clp protease ATP-binding subunit ClpA